MKRLPLKHDRTGVDDIIYYIGACLYNNNNYTSYTPRRQEGKTQVVWRGVIGIGIVHVLYI